ncbi:MAG: hypothetical protein IT491_16215 [Gammaproteobacteria bacterium]|nr:hypothetical protein [Gammaproteobacteria bacterium]
MQTHSTNHQAVWRCRWGALILAGGLLATANAAEAAWTAAIKPDPITRQQRCLLSSDPQTTSDGYDSTPVTLVFNGTSLLAITESELDISFNDLQLVVDKEPPFRSDKLEHKKMTLVFDQDLPGLTQKLRVGKQATVSLRFWPTWPATQLFPVTFSLAGFSKAHDSLTQGCQPPPR